MSMAHTDLFLYPNEIIKTMWVKNVAFINNLELCEGRKRLTGNNSCWYIFSNTFYRQVQLKKINGDLL